MDYVPRNSTVDNSLQTLRLMDVAISSLFSDESVFSTPLNSLTLVIVMIIMFGDIYAMIGDSCYNYVDHERHSLECAKS